MITSNDFFQGFILFYFELSKFWGIRGLDLYTPAVWKIFNYFLPGYTSWHLHREIILKYL